MVTRERELQARREAALDASGQTHAEGCYAWGARHYECALEEVRKLQTSVRLLQLQVQTGKELLACFQRDQT